MADYVKDGDTYSCSKCGDWVGKRSGYYKHAKKCAGTQGTESVEPPTSPATDEPASSPAVPPSQEPAEEISWESFGADLEVETDTTDYIPTPLTIAAKRAKGLSGKSAKKMSVKEKKMLEETNITLIKQFAGLVDFGLTRLGRYATMDEEFVVKHGNGDKEMVANATWAYMDEKEIYPSVHISTGLIAGGLWAYYVAPPVMRIRKQAKKKLLKNGGKRLLSWVPIFGRRFRKKKPQGSLEEWGMQNDES